MQALLMPVQLALLCLYHYLEQGYDFWLPPQLPSEMLRLFYNLYKKENRFALVSPQLLMDAMHDMYSMSFYLCHTLLLCKS